MQTLPVFSIYDSKAKFFGQPHLQQNADVALRAFSNAVNTPGNPIYEHPEDYSLIEIGTFDDETGVLSPAPHTNHGVGSSLVKSPQ